MAGRPGVTVARQAQRVVPGVSTDTGTAFIIGLCDAGSTASYELIESMDDYESAYSDTANLLYDSVETFFGEDGSRCYVVRVADTDLDADWLAALDLLSAELGPGQVLAPGESTAVRHGQLLTHAADNNRVALIDSDEDDDAAAVAATAAAASVLSDADRGMLTSQWLDLPERTAGVPRTVPPSPVVAGLCARLGDQPNVWPIGPRGLLNFATSVTVEFTDAERTTLTSAGANVILDDPNGLRLYGFRGVSEDELYQDFGISRLIMRVEAEGRAIAEQYVGSRITNETIGAFGAALEGFMQGLYVDGALFGDTAADAYRVATDSPVNTAATAAAGEINAEVYVRGAGHAELVRITTVSVPVNGNV